MLIVLSVIMMVIILDIVVLTLELNTSVMESEEYVEKRFIRLSLFLALIGTISLNMIWGGIIMSNISKINYIISKVFEIADNYNIDVMSDLSTNIVTGNRELVFRFRKGEKRLDRVIDVSSIYLIKDIDLIVNSVIEKMEELVWIKQTNIL